MTISSEIVTAIVTALVTLAGGAAVGPILINYYLKRRDLRIDRTEKQEEEMSAATIADAGKFREELWREYKTAIERNDQLSTRNGLLVQENASLAGKLQASQEQTQILIGRLTTEGMRVADAEDRAKKDRLAREQVEGRFAYLVERHRELEKDLAIATRGRATRKSDLEQEDHDIAARTKVIEAPAARQEHKDEHRTE